MMVAFIDQYRACYGVEPICKELPIAPSTYYRYKALQRQPEKRSARAQSDDQFSVEIQRVWEESHRNYGARKVWKPLNRESIPAARCTVERLMKTLGIEGVRRGKRYITTLPDEAAHKPLDRVKRQFSASRPNQLWVADITYVATWSDFVYVAKLIMGLLFPLGDGVYLSIDRTNGQWEKKNINLLVLSVCYRGAAMPLYWMSLDKYSTPQNLDHPLR